MADRDELLRHEYDGIQEYDNDLPRWWLWLFAATMVFGVFRVGYYHFGPGLLQDERIKIQLSELDQAQAAAEQAAPKSSDSEDDLLRLASDRTAVAKGQEVYGSKCLPCHGAQGQGLIGPNLTDGHWIHGGTMADIKRVVEDGVLQKGMIAWKGTLSEEEIKGVAAYIWGLHGTNPPNPKAPEGTLVVRN